MKQEKKSPKENSSAVFAAIRIRGINEIKTTIEDTLRMLRLYRKNYCAVFPDNAVYTGMLKHAKDYLTWGEIDDETFKMLVEKRGEEFAGRETDRNEKIKSNDFVVINGKKMKKFFRLNAPKKGYGKKGIKYPFSSWGALGYRGAAINDLIKRML